MVKHVVMWRYEDKGDIEIAKEQLLRMQGKVPSMLDIEVGVDFNGSPAAYDLVLITSHEDRAALEVYQADPVHGEVKKVLGTLKSERTVVDFDC